jgi:hypothetical protein
MRLGFVGLTLKTTTVIALEVLICHATRKYDELEIDNIYIFPLSFPPCNYSIVCQKLIQAGEAVNEAYYLECLSGVVQRKTGNVECRNKAPLSQQCTSSHGVVGSVVFGTSFDFCLFITSLLTRRTPSRLIPLPQNKNYPERKRFQRVEGIIINMIDHLRVIHQTPIEWCFQ